MSKTTTTCSPSVDYFSLVTQRPLNINSSSSLRFWDDVINNDSEILSDTESFLTTPTTPPQSVYQPPQTKTPEETSAFDNFGTVEDWMCWDSPESNPSDKALSPTSQYFPELKLEPASPIMTGINSQSVSIEYPENLYSTPLSWARPRQQIFGSLTPEEELKLRSIAMPARTTYPESPSSKSSPGQDHGLCKKRKNSIEEDEDEDMERPRRMPVKKTAHNMIEKRYRTNLNDKIAALRDSVPSLRVMTKNPRGEDVEEDLQGLTPAHKVNKATVLAKATEYIAHLENRNKHINRENAQLKARIEAFEMLMSGQSNPMTGPRN